MERHLSFSLIERWRRGELGERELQGARHHVANCDVCRARAEKAPRSNRNPIKARERVEGRIESSVYSKILDAVFETAIDESQRLERERASAPDLVADLSSFSINQVKLVVANSEKYRGWGVAEQLLDGCRSGWSDDPAWSERLADLAIHVIDSIPVQGFRARLLNDLRAEAWSYLANCRRIQSKLKDAASAFERAEELLRVGTGDITERARLFDLKASLYLTMGHYESAAEALRVAIQGYRSVGDHHLEGRILLKEAKLLHDTGNVDKSLQVLERAARLIDVQRDPYLGFVLKWKKLYYHVELNRNAEAARLLPEVRELAKSAPRIERIRFLWTEGLLCRNLGQYEMSEQIFIQVREGFLAHGLAHDVAEVSLELAALYLETGKHSKVREIAAETMPLFSALNVTQELLIVWSLFQQAVERETATAQLVQEMAKRVRAAH